MLQIVLLRPELVPDHESVGPAEVGHGPAVELSACKVIVRVREREGIKLLAK